MIVSGIRKRMNQFYSNCIVGYVMIVLSHPQLTILVPSLTAFSFAYPILYDWIVRQFQLFLDSGRSSYKIQDELHSLKDSHALLELLRNGRHTLGNSISNEHEISLTEIKFTSEMSTLTLGFFHLLEGATQNLLANLSNQANPNSTSAFTSILISPLNWLPSSFSPTSKVNINDINEIKAFNNYLVKYLNYNSEYLFIDNVVEKNHLIKFVKTIRVYLIHSRDSVCELSNLPSRLRGNEVITYTDANIVKDFIRYFLVKNSSLFYSNIFLSFTNIIGILVLIAYIFFVYLAISNNGKIRSSFGLLVGWLVEILVSVFGAINLLDSSRVILDPIIAPFTAGSLVVLVMTFSSRNLFTIINELALGNSRSFRAKRSQAVDSTNLAAMSAPRKIHKQLFQFYYGVPEITKSLILFVLGVLVLNYLPVLAILKLCNYNELCKRVNTFVKTLILAMCIDHWLQLTYLVGVVTIDLNRFELLDILTRQQRNSSVSNHSSRSGDEYFGEGMNFISSYLLKSNAPFQLRPARLSTRYKLGELFLNIKFPLLTKVWLFVFPALAFYKFMVLLLTWALVFPTSTTQELKELFDWLYTLHVTNGNDFLYYLEFSSMILFILAISSLVFRLTPSKITDLSKSRHIEESFQELKNNDFIEEAKQKKAEGVDSNDSTTNKNQFNVIELPERHQLDIIQLVCGRTSPFIVSIGLDHRVLIWSPLIKPHIPEPINISSKSLLLSNKREFWPINYIDMSEEGDYIVLLNYRYRLMKLFSRKSLQFLWEIQLSPTKDGSKFKVLDSFFRKRTVPGFLARKILEKNKSSTFKSKTLQQDDFIMVLQTGELISVSCSDGTVKVMNIIDDVYKKKAKGALNKKNDIGPTDIDNSVINLRLNNVKALFTPRVNDRIICNVTNSDVLVGIIVNNNWKFRNLALREGEFNKGITDQMYIPPPLQPMRSRQNSIDVDFASIAREEQRIKQQSKQYFIELHQKSITYDDSSVVQINKPAIVVVEFVGMVVRLKNMVAELIDIQSGIIIRTFALGNIKPNLLRVTHSEPTHCRFCGCASVQSFLIIYQEEGSKRLIVHTFRIDEKRAKSNICLRVERDPREIRCLGFNAAIEHQFWFNNVEAWESTDVNMIIGLRRETGCDDDDDAADVDDCVDSKQSFLSGMARSDYRNIDQIIDSTKGLLLVRNRRILVSETLQKSESGSSNNTTFNNGKRTGRIEGFIITNIDGKLIPYEVPTSDSSLSEDNNIQLITCIQQFGYKSVAVNVNNKLKILYLGSDKLIERNLYYCGTQATMGLVLNGVPGTGTPTVGPTSPTGGTTSDLLFINKRRRMQERKLNA